MKLDPLPNRPENTALNSLIEANNANADRVTALEAVLAAPIPPQGEAQPAPQA